MLRYRRLVPTGAAAASLALVAGLAGPALAATPDEVATGLISPLSLAVAEDGTVYVTQNFAGMLSDGIADGSVRAVDPLVASQLIMPALNAAYEARGWAARQPDPALAVKLYAWTLCAGVFTDPPEVG